MRVGHRSRIRDSQSRLTRSPVKQTDRLFSCLIATGCRQGHRERPVVRQLRTCLTATKPVGTLTRYTVPNAPPPDTLSSGRGSCGTLKIARSCAAVARVPGSRCTRLNFVGARTSIVDAGFRKEACRKGELLSRTAARGGGDLLPAPVSGFDPASGDVLSGPASEGASSGGRITDDGPRPREFGLPVLSSA